MKKIPAKPDELKNAFRIHSSAILDNTSISYNLLLFYAVESGLKSIYLRDSKLSLQDTSEISDKNLWSGGGHDLTEWIKVLKVPASGIGYCQSFKLKRDNLQKTQTWGICHAHQVWRYGIEIDENDQQDVVLWLEALKNLIKENLE